MKTFLVIEHANPDDEYDNGNHFIASGETFFEALKTHYYDENIRELICNVEQEDLDRHGWPKITDCYLPNIEVYEIVAEVADAQKQLFRYGQAVLDSAIEEQKKYLEATPEREKQEKIEKLRQQAAELGLSLEGQEAKKKATKKKAKKETNGR